MKIPILKDFQKWQELNKGNNFSFYDYIFHVMNLNKLSSDIYFAFLELFWPKFTVYKNYIILRENFSEEKIENLIKKNEKVEFWMNLFITDPFFENEEDKEERAESLAKSLMETWQVKLKRDFPTKDFIVKYVSDKECGDYGLTFYQKKVDFYATLDITKVNQFVDGADEDASRPNVKENKLNNSPNGPVPGRSMVRPVRPEEIPKR